MFFKRKSTEFHDMQMECQRKIILIHLLLCYLFWSPTYSSHPNLLAHKSLTLPSLAPLSLAPKISLRDLSLPHSSLAPTHLFPGLILSNLFHDYCIFPPTLFCSKLLPDCSLPSAHPVPGLLLPNISLPNRLLPTIYRLLALTRSLVFWFFSCILLSNIPLV